MGTRIEFLRQPSIKSFLGCEAEFSDPVLEEGLGPRSHLLIRFLLIITVRVMSSVGSSPSCRTEFDPTFNSFISSCSSLISLLNSAMSALDSLMLREVSESGLGLDDSFSMLVGEVGGGELIMSIRQGF